MQAQKPQPRDALRSAVTSTFRPKPRRSAQESPSFHRLGSFFANRAPGRLPLRPDLKGQLTAREAREERGKIVLSAVPSSHGPMTRIRYSSLSLFRTGIGFGWVRSRKAFRRSCGARKPDADYMALSGGRATRTEEAPGNAGAKFLGGDQKGTIAVKFRWRPTAQSAAEPCRSPSRRRG